MHETGSNASRPGATIPPLRALWVGSAAAAWALLAATVAIALTPRVRGLGFPPSLRLALLGPACLGAGLVAAFTWRAVAGRPAARSTLAIALGALAAAILATWAIAGGATVSQAAPPVVVAAGVLAVVVPRWASRRAGPVATASMALLVAAQGIAVAGALRAERAPPRSGSLAFDVPRHLVDAEHHVADLPGGARVHYLDEGQGPTLLFLHGNPAWSFQWRELVGGLRGSFRCVAPDYPGFGLSTGPAGFGHTPAEQSRVVEELVDHLQLRDVTLVVQDWGGPIGLAFAARRPELVRRVVLGSTWAWPTTTAEPRGKFSWLVGGPLGELVQMNWNGFARAGIANGVVGGLSDEELEVYVRPFQAPDRRGIAAYYPGQINAGTAWFVEVERGLARLRDKEALIFWAARDAGFPPADLARWQAHFPRHTTIELPDTDHFFFEDAAGVMIPKIATFAAGRATEMPPGP